MQKHGSCAYRAPLSGVPPQNVAVGAYARNCFSSGAYKRMVSSTASNVELGKRRGCDFASNSALSTKGCAQHKKSLVARKLVFITETC